MSLPTVGAGLLVAGGLINALPPVAQKLSSISGGKPVVQILVGILSAVIGLLLVTNIF